MDERALVARYAAIGLAVVGTLEWLLGRTVSRLASAPPLEGVARTIIETLGRLGIFLLSPAFVLALALLFLSLAAFGAKATRTGAISDLALGIFLSIFAIVVVLSTLAYALRLVSLGSFIATGLTLGLNALSLGAVWWLALRFAIASEAQPIARLAVALIALGYTGWYYYVFQQSLQNLGMVQGGAPVFVRDLGEAVAVDATVALFAATAMAHRQWARRRRWILPIVLAVGFAGGSIADILANTGFTGVFATWSLGFNLFLPWPIYAVALALFAYSVLTCFASEPAKAAYATPNTGLGMLLLLFAGYSLQLSYQHLVAVLAIALLTGVCAPLTPEAIATSAEGYHLKSSTSS